MVTTIRQTTAHIPASQRFDYWQDAILTGGSMRLHDDQQSFSCERSLSISAYGSVMDTVSTPFTLERTARHIARDDRDMAVIGTMIRGEGHLRQGGREVIGTPGDLYLCDIGKPQSCFTVGGYREVRIHVDRHYFESRVGRIDVLAGYCFPKSSALTTLASSYVASYVATVPMMSPEEAALGLDAVLHLTAGLVKLTGATRGHADDAELSPNSMLALAKKYIEDHLFDPGLDAARIKNALGISRTRLYEVFGELGGVNSAVRDARLDRVNAILCDRSDNRRIEQISRSCGFLDYPSFCRAYRRRFGQTPRDTREESSTLQFQPTSLR